MDSGKKILFGCLGGCGLLLLMIVGSCVGFTLWLNAPGEVLEPRIMLSPETTGYVEWTLRLEDPGTAEFAEEMLRGLDKAGGRSGSALPQGLEQFINARQMKSARRDLKKLFPIVVAWAARPGAAPEEDEHLFSVSARGLGHRMAMFDWMLGLFFGWTPDVETVRHRGEKIYLLGRRGDTRAATFIHDGIVFVATDLDSARQMLDRMASPTAAPATGAELAALFAGLPQDRSLRGALTNQRGELRRILEVFELSTEYASTTAWDEVRGATIVADFRDQDTFAGTVELLGPDPEWARANASMLGAGLESLFERSRIEFGIEVHALERRVRIEFSAAHLLDQLEEH